MFFSRSKGISIRDLGGGKAKIAITWAPIFFFTNIGVTKLEHGSLILSSPPPTVSQSEQNNCPCTTFATSRCF
jgi:hypothetical protein